jgi:alpha-1,3-rhamnosyl/mannosyltransferase
VLEGFASQTPVITSNSTSLPEVAADAAWMLDPMDVYAMADAMATLAADQALAQDFAAKGLLRARAFTWDACAEQTLKVYERVLSKS